MMDMSCICVVSYVTTSYMWLSGTSKVASATEELNFKRRLILINLDVNSHMGSVAFVLDEVAPELGKCNG